MTQLAIFEPTRALSQWFTPEWAAVELVDRYFPDLTAADLVIEPSCGLGAFLKAIPEHVPAIGVELDPDVARAAAENSGREIICADFCTAALPDGITAIIGNPPFQVRTISHFLARARHLLPGSGRCGFILPAYAMQTHNTVVRWLEHWSMRADLLPRRLFPRARLPLLFVVFTRGADREMIGFALYHEAVAVDRMSQWAKKLAASGAPKRGVWRAIVEAALSILGGQGTLAEIYELIEHHRPTPNAFWREKIRQVLQMHFVAVERGVWRYE